MMRAEILTKVRARIDAHCDDLVRDHAESLTADDDLDDVLTEATALHDELASYRADLLDRITQIVDTEAPMTKTDVYLAKFTADLDQRMVVARDKVRSHLITMGATEAVIAEGLAYFETVAAAERHELLGQTRALLRRVPPDFDLRYPQR
jgi:hypothetical protein